MNMTSTEATLALPASFDERAFESFLDSREEPGWIVDLRRRAFDRYREQFSIPLDPEEWKRVDLRTFRPETYSLQPARRSSVGQKSAPIETLLRDRAAFAGQTTHLDGHCTQSTLDESLTRQGVLFGDLSRLLRDHRDLLEPHLMARAVLPETDRFSAWHSAFFTGGTLLYVPRNVEITEPLHSLIALCETGAADFSHTLVVLEEGASATLLEETASAQEQASGLHVGAVELLVAPGARLRYIQLQNWNKRTWHFAHQVGRVERDASLQWTLAGLGSRLAHVHQEVSLDGRGAAAQVNGVTFATDRQRLSYHTQQTHNAADTTSDLLYKQVLRDHSRVVWRGMIRVEPEAQKTDGYQRCDALLLSPTCRNDAIPGLEIEADDVRCTHGATSGRVDEEQVFYCMSRGMSRFEAMHIIVEGFFHSVYDRIELDVVRQTLSRAVERKLGIGD